VYKEAYCTRRASLGEPAAGGSPDASPSSPSAQVLNDPRGSCWELAWLVLGVGVARVGLCSHSVAGMRMRHAAAGAEDAGGG